MVMTQRTAPKMSVLGAVLALAVVGVGVVVTPSLACPPEEQESQQRLASSSAPEQPIG